MSRLPISIRIRWQWQKICQAFRRRRLGRRTWITIENIDGAIRLPLGEDLSAKREDGDIIISRAVDLASGLEIEMQLLASGEWRWCHTRPCQRTNTHWHFSRLSPQKGQEATEPQRAAIARLWLGIRPPFGLGRCGGPLSAWALSGIDPQEISRRYGTGKRIYLNG